MDAATRALVRIRAGNQCEYCGLHKDQSPLAALQVEHILPRNHGGTDDEHNLATACIDCNLGKGSNLAGLDPEMSGLTRLFHPRTDRSDEHFERRGAAIISLTPIGRTTIVVLNMNAEDQLELRALVPEA